MGSRVKGGRWARRVFATSVLFFSAACGGGDGTGPGDGGSDPALAPFVGDWQALAMVLTNKANPSVAPDLIQLGAQFTINVQPSGQYTAILLYMQASSTEIGRLSVAGSTVVLERTFPSAETSSATFQFTDGHLILDGDSEFDFNLDGTPEPAQAHIVLERR